MQQIDENVDMKCGYETIDRLGVMILSFAVGRYDLHHAILSQGGYLEVGQILGRRMSKEGREPLIASKDEVRINLDRSRSMFCCCLFGKASQLKLVIFLPVACRGASCFCFGAECSRRS